jgi:hypothetical protein
MGESHDKGRVRANRLMSDSGVAVEVRCQDGGSHQLFDLKRIKVA